MQVDSGLRAQPAEPNQQILVRNVSTTSSAKEIADVQLPWSTSNEDLVELFETIGNVVMAEILFEGSRSKGEGIVQFTETAEAQTAGEKFTGYAYGGRPLGKCLSMACSRRLTVSDVQFNPRWHDFSATAAKGGQPAA